MASLELNVTSFEDFYINIKFKISALWSAVMFCYVYGDYIHLHVPGVMAEALALKQTAEDINTQLMFVAVALFMAVPSIMIFLSLCLRPNVNRLLNIAIGFLYIAVMISTMISEQWAYYLILGVFEIAITGLIIWYAWNWPRKDK